MSEEIKKEPSAEDLKEIESDVCPLCDGTGEVSCDVWNDDAHCYEPTGTEKCICKIEDEDDVDDQE